MVYKLHLNQHSIFNLSCFPIRHQFTPHNYLAGGESNLLPDLFNFIPAGIFKYQGVSLVETSRSEKNFLFIFQLSTQSFPCRFNRFASLFFRHYNPSKLMTCKKTVFRSFGSALVCPYIALLMGISYIRTINHGKHNWL